MTRFATPFALFAAFVLLPALGCQDKGHSKTDGGGGASPHAARAAGKTAVATIKPAKGAATQPANQSVTGKVTFTQAGDSVKVVADLAGLAPGRHGFHIHEKADLSAADLSSAGGHWDPDGHKLHGGPNSDPDKRHAGDMGNIEADAGGKAHLEIMLADLSIGDGGKYDVVGHSVVVHAKEDDMKDIKSAGGRVAAGAIEMKK